MIEEINPPESYSEDEEAAFAPPPPRNSSSTLPWVVAVISLLLAGAVALYGHRQGREMSTRVAEAERMRSDINGRFNKLEEDRKAAVTQATELVQKNEELNAKTLALTEQLKNKDA